MRPYPPSLALFVIAAALLGRSALAAPRASPSSVAAEYDVTAGEGARELRIEAAFQEPPAGGLVFADGMGRYVREVEVRRGQAWTASAVEGDAVGAAACARGCRVRYRFLLADATRGGRMHDAAFAQGDAIVAGPSLWLARPARRGPGRYRLRVTTPPGLVFATGLFPGPPGAYEADLADLPEAPYSAFGAFAPVRVRVPGAEVDVVVLPGPIGVPSAALVEWVERAAGDVAAYYRRFPIPRALVIVIPGGRRAVGYGTTMGNGGASIMIWVGEGARADDLRRDWVLTHEMAHFVLPNLPRAQSWMEEGLATYVEPVARARRGHLSVEEVWADLVRKTPQAVNGSSGFDQNRGFGPIYWGGALFWLLADIEIREKTGGRRSLEDALAAVRAAGGSIAVTWDVDRVLETADRGVGVSVLVPLFARMARSAPGVDLRALWARLGVEDAGGRIQFRDDAPLAAIRKAITAGVDPGRPATPRP